MLNLDVLRSRIRNGFKPFAFYLSDGRKVPVPHSQFISVGRSMVFVIGDDDMPRYIDSLHIVSLEDMQAPE